MESMGKFEKIFYKLLENNIAGGGGALGDTAAVYDPAAGRISSNDDVYAPGDARRPKILGKVVSRAGTVGSKKKKKKKEKDGLDGVYLTGENEENEVVSEIAPVVLGLARGAAAAGRGVAATGKALSRGARVVAPKVKSAVKKAGELAMASPVDDIAAAAVDSVVKKFKKKDKEEEVPEEDAEKKKADRCKRRADAVYGKKTSAYKSGAIVRCRQDKNWKKKK